MPISTIQPLPVGRLADKLREFAQLAPFISGCVGSGPANVRIDFTGNPSQALIDFAYNYARSGPPTGFDWSASAHSSWLATRHKTKAKEDYDSPGSYRELLNAVAIAAKISDNALRNWLMNFKVEVAAATSLVNLQTRVANLANLPEITNENVRDTIRNILN